jgi:hypothetical protein
VIKAYTLTLRIAMRSTFGSAGKRRSDDRPTSAATKNVTVVKNPKTFCTRTSDECMAARFVQRLGGKGWGVREVGKVGQHRRITSR